MAYSTIRTPAQASLLVALGVAASSCGLVLGLDDFSEGNAQTSTSGGGSTSTTTTAVTTTSSSTGSGGMGGGGGGPACKDGETLPCETGLKGSCSAGKKTCLADLSGFGPCAQNVQPTAMDDCVNKQDTSCDGEITCACSPGSTTTCATGLAAACASGSATCKQDGTGFGACVPDVMPTASDDCSALTDTNCNGTVDCSCQAGMTSPCASGLPGVCAAGTQTCKQDGTGFGACVSDIAPGAMPEDCKKIGDENCDGTACSECVWSFLAGDANYEIPKALAIDAAGNIFVVGSFDGTLKLLNKAANTSVTLNTAGLSDIFLAKLTPAGDVIWAKSFGDAMDGDGGYAVATNAAGDVVIAGAFSKTLNFGGGALTATGSADVFVAKYDANGNHKWSKRFGASASNFASVATAVAFDPAGDVVAGGRMGGVVTFGATTFPATDDWDSFVTKLSGATGAVAWAKQIKEQPGGPSGRQLLEHLTVDGSGNIFIAGQFTGSIFLAAGAVTSGGTSNDDAFIAKLDGNGTVSWGKGFGSAALTEEATSIAVDSSGNVVVTGTVGNSTNFGGGIVNVPAAGFYAYLAKYSTIGAYLNAKIYSSTLGARGYSLDVDGTDNIYLTGFMGGTMDLGTGPLNGGGSSDIFLAKLDGGLATQWSKTFGDAKDQISNSLRYDKSSKTIVLAGTAQSSIDFGCGLLVGMSQVTHDLALAKLQP